MPVVAKHTCTQPKVIERSDRRVKVYLSVHMQHQERLHMSPLAKITEACKQMLFSVNLEQEISGCVIHCTVFSTH